MKAQTGELSSFALSVKSNMVSFLLELSFIHSNKEKVTKKKIKLVIVSHSALFKSNK